MEKERIRILYIDDDAANLNVFKASFRLDYQIFLARSAAEGYKILQEESIHIIIADQKMPEVTGIDFFASILKEYPDTIRILLTGFTDIESVIDAINKGQVYRYIKKPWDEQELKVAIENSYEFYCTRQELKKKNEELRKANDELNRFVYSTSHDLKAPLMTILGILKVARMEQSQDDPHLYLNMVENSVKNLEIFIRNIVNYYKNERTEEELSEISFKKLLEENIESYKFFETFDEIKFNTDVQQTGKFVNDEFRLKIILSNLLSNSIIFQKEDGKEKIISISVNTNEKEAVINFKDNGIGIPEKYLDKVFTMFFRGTPLSKGSGIGLYIVKEALKKINGKINVDSREGIGTEVNVIIPNKQESKP